jgi:acylphosphatase
MSVPGPSEALPREHSTYIREAISLAQTRENRLRKNIASRLRLWLHFVVPQTADHARTITTSRRRLNVFYSGHVQGVGFRYTVRQVAAGFEVAGMVSNLPDGRVELVAEGSAEELNAFRQAIRDAGLDHFIQDEQVDWSEAQGGLRGFEIPK